MNHWQVLDSDTQLEALIESSYKRPQLIFKHSTRCGISAHVLHVLQASTASLEQSADLHYLDLIAFRPISNRVASDLNVPHQSPQVIMVIDGKAVHQASHFSIAPEEILAAV